MCPHGYGDSSWCQKCLEDMTRMTQSPARITYGRNVIEQAILNTVLICPHGYEVINGETQCADCLELWAAKQTVPYKRTRRQHELANSMPAGQRASRFDGAITAARPSWDDYYLTIASDAATRATCPAGRVGCIIVSPEGVPLIFGYNGAPAGVAHCDQRGCSWVVREDDGLAREYPRHVHAEANAIARAARVGSRLDKATMYVTQEPCPECLKLCLQAGLACIVVGTVKDSDWMQAAESIALAAGMVLRTRKDERHDR